MLSRNASCSDTVHPLVIYFHIPGIELGRAVNVQRQLIAANIAPVEVRCNVNSFKPFSNNGISVSVSKLKPAKKVIERTGAYNTGVVSGDNEERTIFTINGGSSRWIVEPDQGAFIASWLFNGKEFSHPGPKQGLAIDGPWLPTARFIHPFKFVKAGKTADGVVLEFKHILNSKDNGPTIQISQPQAEFVTADKKYSLCVSIAPEIDFNGFASWDAPMP